MMNTYIIVQRITSSFNHTHTIIMASEMVIPGASFNPASDMKYTKPKVNSVGGRSVGIVNSKTSTVLNLSSPLMLTWGVQSFTDDKSGKVSYDLALQFPNEGFETPATKKFLENMAAFEKKIKEDAITNSKEWFSKPKMTSDAVDALWTPVLKYPKNKDTLEADTSRAPTIKVKLPFWDGAWKELELYDVDMQPVFPDSMNPALSPQDLIAKGSHIAVSIQCGGIWFANGKFGVTWKLFQAIVKPKMSLKGKCHIKLDDEDKTKIVSQVVPTDVDGDADGDDHHDNVSAVIEDDEDDEPVAAVPVRSTSSAAVVKPAAPAAAPVAVGGGGDAASKKKIVRKV
jgi:hypothetical protein